MNAQGAVHAPDGAQAKRFGPYTILEEVARGGQAAVLKARHDTSGKPVAIKMLLEPTPTKVKRFRQEARVLAALSHPNLPRVTDLGERNGVTYMVMEFVQGEDLEVIVRTRGVPDLGWTAQVLGTVAHTVQHCHGLGLIHRDLKPANVLIERETGRPVLVDFGLVKRDPEKLGLESLDAEGPLSRSGELRGTPSYMAPEQASSVRFGEVGPKTDVYGLGATLYFLLTGAPPFGGDVLVSLLKRVVDEPPPDPCRVNRRVPPALGRLCVRAMAKQPDARIASASELAEILVAAAAIEPLSLSATIDGAQVHRRLAEETADLGVPLSPGDPTQLGPYGLEALLGKGGMGSVFRARHQSLGVVRAVKVLPAFGAGGAKRIQRFQREIEHLARVRDPNVIAIHDAGREAEFTWYAMDLVEGQPLNERIAEAVPYARALELTLGIARGVAALHRAGIVHRDLKPHNVVLRGDGQPIVIDLGLAVAPELDERLTKTGAVVGTPRYMAPEQLRGKPPNARADVYALGLILFELTTGRSPHGEGSAPHEMLAKIINVQPPTPSSIVPTLPRALDALCARLLARDPDQRPADAGAVASELSALRWGRTGSSWGRPLLAAAGLVLIFAGVAFGLSRRTANDVPAPPPTPRAEASGAPQARRALSAEELAAGEQRITKLERVRPARTRAGAARAWLRRYPGHPRAAQVEAILSSARREFPVRRFADASQGVFVDATRLLTWSRPLGTIRLWDIGRERELYRWKFPVVLSALAVAPDGGSFLVGERGRQIRWIKISTRETIARWPIDLTTIDSLAFSPTQNLVAVAARGGKLPPALLARVPGSARGRASFPVVRLLDLASGKSVFEVGPHWGQMVQEVAFSPDGRRLVTVGGTTMIGQGLGERRDPDNAVRVFELPSGRLIKRSRLTSKANFARFAPNGKTFAVGGNGGQLFLYDIRGARLRAFTRPEAKRGGVGGVFVTAHLFAGRGAAFTADGNRLHVAVGEVDTNRGGLAVWDVPSGARVRQVRRLPALWALELSSDGQHLLTGSKRGVELWWAR